MSLSAVLPLVEPVRLSESGLGTPKVTGALILDPGLINLRLWSRIIYIANYDDIMGKIREKRVILEACRCSQ
jgi:hypothetical protein